MTFTTRCMNIQSITICTITPFLHISAYENKSCAEIEKNQPYLLIITSSRCYTTRQHIEMRTMINYWKVALYIIINQRLPVCEKKAVTTVTLQPLQLEHQQSSELLSSVQIWLSESFLSSLTCSIIDGDSITESYECNFGKKKYLENILRDFGLEPSLKNGASLLTVLSHSKDSTFSDYVVSISL